MAGVVAGLALANPLGLWPLVTVDANAGWLVANDGWLYKSSTTNTTTEGNPQRQDLDTICLYGHPTPSQSAQPYSNPYQQGVWHTFSAFLLPSSPCPAASAPPGAR